jgi:hypothetical protein
MDIGIVGALPILFIGLLQFAWYVGVAVMLYKIWQKVKHLPG